MRGLPLNPLMQKRSWREILIKMAECGAQDGAICPIYLNSSSDGVKKAMFEMLVCCWDELLYFLHNNKYQTRVLRFDKGPSIKDVRKNLDFWTPSLPLVHSSRNLSVLFVCKIWGFLNPPAPLRVDVLYEWSLS